MKIVAGYIRTTPDFPEPDVMFRDITIILQNAEGLHLAIDSLREALRDADYDLVVSPESRGFIFGVPLAYTEYRPLVPIQKQRKLPAKTISKTYKLEHGHVMIGTHKDVTKLGRRVVVADDLIVTSGTAEAMVCLIGKLGGEVVKMLSVTELKRLHGRKKLKGYSVSSLVSYEGE